MSLLVPSVIKITFLPGYRLLHLLPPDGFNGTANPNHVAAGFPQDCRTCHSTISWTGATFDHNTATKFPRPGPYQFVLCAVSQKQRVRRALDCVHLLPSDGFQRHDESEPPGRRIPQDCSLCHSTTNWQGATFNHNNTPFPLTGAHINVAPCAQVIKTTCSPGSRLRVSPAT